MERPVSNRGTIQLTVDALENTKAPIKLGFKDMTYAVKGRILLNNVTGYVLPGHTHYIMGASGAGKTTMLNAIAGRIKRDKHHVLMGGEVMLNDSIEVNGNNFGKFGGYVMQDDILYEFFTVQQCLTFAARLKLSKLSFDEQDRRVKEIAKNMGLIKCFNTQCGSVHRKTISGGERKRVSIAIEMVSDPSLLILDEPTSGLDSFKSLEIASLLFKLARDEGKTIISTIH
jgi:ATP-binding cassette, subfamily G (WHITE), eye pigment precursor transporter